MNDSQRTETVDEDDIDENIYSMDNLFTQQMECDGMYNTYSEEEEEEEEEEEARNEIELKDTDQKNTIWCPTSSNEIFESTETSDVTVINKNLMKALGTLDEKNKSSIWNPLSDEMYGFTDSSNFSSNEQRKERTQNNSCVFEVEEEGDLFYTGETRSLPRMDSHPVSESVEKAKSFSQTQLTQTRELHSSLQTSDESLQDPTVREPKCALVCMFDREKDDRSIDSVSDKASKQTPADSVRQVGPDEEQVTATSSKTDKRSENIDSVADNSLETEEKDTLVVDLEPSLNTSTHESYDASKSNNENHDQQNTAIPCCELEKQDISLEIEEENTLVVDLEPSLNTSTHESYDASKSNNENQDQQNTATPCCELEKQQEDENGDKSSPIICKNTEKINDLDVMQVIPIEHENDNQTSNAQNMEQEQDKDNEDAHNQIATEMHLSEENQNVRKLSPLNHATESNSILCVVRKESDLDVMQVIPIEHDKDNQTSDAQNMQLEQDKEKENAQIQSATKMHLNEENQSRKKSSPLNDTKERNNTECVIRKESQKNLDAMQVIRIEHAKDNRNSDAQIMEEEQDKEKQDAQNQSATEVDLSEENQSQKKLSSVNDATERNSIECVIHNESQKKCNLNELQSINQEDEKANQMVEDEQHNNSESSRLAFIETNKEKETCSIGGTQDPNAQNKKVLSNNKKNYSTKLLPFPFAEKNGEKGICILSEKTQDRNKKNYETDDIMNQDKDISTKVSHLPTAEKNGLHGNSTTLDRTENLKEMDNMLEGLVNHEEENSKKSSLLTAKENTNTIDEILDQIEQNEEAEENRNLSKVTFSETPTVICTLSPIGESSHSLHAVDKNGQISLEAVANSKNVESSGREESVFSKAYSTLKESCDDHTGTHDISIDSKNGNKSSTSTSASIEKKVDFDLGDALNHSQNKDHTKDNAEFSNSMDTDKSSPILLRHESICVEDNISFKTKATNSSLKPNESISTSHSKKTNLKASAWITPNKTFYRQKDLPRLVLPQHLDHVDSSQEHEFTDNEDEGELVSPGIKGVDFFKPDTSQETLLQNTQEDDGDLRERSRNVLNRLRRGISFQHDSCSTNDENVHKYRNEHHEVDSSIENNNDEHIDDALESLISKYEEKLTEYEGKICTLEHQLIRSQTIIEEKDKHINSLKRNHKHIQSHIERAEKKLNKRKLPIATDETLASLKVGGNREPGDIIDDHMSIEENEQDNASLASSDASVEDNVHETVSFSSSEGEHKNYSDEENLQAEVEEDEEWDDYVLMKESNDRLTFKSFKSIVKITQDFLSESQACSYKNLLWKPIWNILKAQGESSTMRWKYGKNPNLLGPNWIFLPPKSGRKKLKGVDYFDMEDDVLREVFYCIKLIDIRSISDGELSELGTLCSLEFNVSRKLKKAEPSRATPPRRSSSTSQVPIDKPKIQAQDQRKRKSKSFSELETATTAKKRKSSSTSSRTKKPKTRPLEQKKRKTKFLDEMEASKPEYNEQVTNVNVEQKKRKTKFLDEREASKPENNEQVTNINEHSQSTLVGADMLLSLVHSDAPDHRQSTEVSTKKFAVGNDQKHVANEVNDIQPSSDHKVNDDTHSLLEDGLFGIGDFAQILNTRDVATKSGIAELTNMRNEARIARKQSTTKDRSPPVKSNGAQLITPMKSPHASHKEMLPHFSQSPDSPPTSVTSKLSAKKTNNKNSLLENYSFFVSGVQESVIQCIVNLGGTVITDTQKLAKLSYRKRLFFLSEPSSRKKHKYILAAALGVPMLHFSWIHEQKRRYDATGGDVSIFDGALYSRTRLPTGLSLNSGIFKLQRASDAKHWKQPIDSTGKPIFDGMSFSVICEQKEREKDWELILITLGATIKDKRDRSTEKGLSRVLNAVIVDTLDLPPYTKAPPSRLSSFLKRVDNSNSPIPLVDFSWVVQSITNRRRLAFDSDPRFLVDILRRDKDELYSIKINAVRYDIGDYVKIKTGSERSFARIVGIKTNSNQRHGYVLDVRSLVQEGDCRLVDPGKCGLNLTVDENDLGSHVIILSSSDYELIKNGYGKESSIFMIKSKY